MLSQDQAYSLFQHNTIVELCQDLEETKREWQGQKSLREMKINREKETRSEPERLIKYSDTESQEKFTVEL